MTTAEQIKPIIVNTYGKIPMAEALAETLGERIDNYDGADRESMILRTCWDWFPGGTTAESTAYRIEQALRLSRE
jgi:hypothetical protein